MFAQVKSISDLDLCNLIEICNSWVFDDAIEKRIIKVSLIELRNFTVLQYST